MSSIVKGAIMAIPYFQSILHPLFLIFGDKKEHTRCKLIDRLGEEFKITEKELKELLPSGRQHIFSNRISWAFTHFLAALAEPIGNGLSD